jgi:cytochrome c biogenesis protein CcmG/thiol:disulfide interchange protein DsbE
MQKGILPLILGIALVATACSAGTDVTSGDAPEPITLDELTTKIAQSGRPTIVNVWASWCLPCRSEAPLLATAATTRTNVDFIALNVRDNPGAAAAFIAQYYDKAPMIHYADRSGTVPIEMGGGRGVPITFFYDQDAALVQIHRGIIDEPTLAFYLDEIQR